MIVHAQKHVCVHEHCVYMYNPVSLITDADKNYAWRIITCIVDHFW